MLQSSPGRLARLRYGLAGFGSAAAYAKALGRTDDGRPIHDWVFGGEAVDLARGA